MKLFREYLWPYRWLVILAMALAGAAQILALYDPIIFGKIIDNYALNVGEMPEDELISGVVKLLLLAIAIALGAQLFSTLK
ncbi:MAG: ABC transporter ATP-binding protein, partial [Flavobacterium sp.]|nr:ABC transporter ATP-binding protein [Flavobacterium sp.]